MTILRDKQDRKNLERLAAYLGWGAGWSVSKALAFLFVALVSFAVCLKFKPFEVQVFDPGLVPFPAVVIIIIFLHGTNSSHARRTLIKVLKTHDGTEKILELFARESSRRRMTVQWSVIILLAVVLGIWLSLVKWMPT